MKVTSIQLGRREISKAEMTGHALALVDQASSSDLILLPEMWPTGFFRFERYPVEAEPIDGPVVQAFREKAAAIGRHILMGSFVERKTEGLFNTSLLIDAQGNVSAVYRKIHLFDEEKKYFAAGSKIVIAETPLGRTGFLICYDLEFPEMARMIALSLTVI